MGICSKSLQWLEGVQKDNTLPAKTSIPKIRDAKDHKESRKCGTVYPGVLCAFFVRFAVKKSFGTPSAVLNFIRTNQEQLEKY